MSIRNPAVPRILTEVSLPHSPVDHGKLQSRSETEEQRQKPVDAQVLLTRPQIQQVLECLAASDTHLCIQVCAAKTVAKFSYCGRFFM